MTYVFSPHAMGEYRLTGVEIDDTSVIQRSDHPGALWNYFWLSNPALDALPGSGANWWKVYSTTRGFLGSCIFDLTEKPEMTPKLSEHPLKFEVWFEEQDPEQFRVGRFLGVQAWRHAVLIRIRQAAERSPPLFRIDAASNLLQIRTG